MDYSKMGAPKIGKNTPRYKGDKSASNARPAGGRASKEELLARMKASAEAKKDE